MFKLLSELIPYSYHFININSLQCGNEKIIISTIMESNVFVFLQSEKQVVISLK